jgi:hypothetical protein
MPTSALTQQINETFTPSVTTTISPTVGKTVYPTSTTSDTNLPSNLGQTFSPSVNSNALLLLLYDIAVPANNFGIGSNPHVG